MITPAMQMRAEQVIARLSELEADTVTGLGEAASRAKQLLVHALDHPRSRRIEPQWIGNPPDDDDRRDPEPQPDPTLSPELETV